MFQMVGLKQRVSRTETPEAATWPLKTRLRCPAGGGPFQGSPQRPAHDGRTDVPAPGRGRSFSLAVFDFYLLRLGSLLVVLSFAEHLSNISPVSAPLCHGQVSYYHSTPRGEEAAGAGEGESSSDSETAPSQCPGHSVPSKPSNSEPGMESGWEVWGQQRVELPGAWGTPVPIAKGDCDQQFAGKPGFQKIYKGKKSIKGRKTPPLTPSNPGQLGVRSTLPSLHLPFLHQHSIIFPHSLHLFHFYLTLPMKIGVK